MTLSTAKASHPPLEHALETRKQESRSAYDRFAWLYDWIVGSRIYHHWAWGTSPRVHDTFARRGLEAIPSGRVIDAGCGSLLFTARAYQELVPPSVEMVLLDASTSMLARGQRRLGKPDARFRFTEGDLNALPLEGSSVDAVFHFGVLHCIDPADRILGEIARVLRDRGQLWLSCLVRSGRRGDALLERLHRAGHVAAPRDEDEVERLVQGAGLSIVESSRSGSFLFLAARKGPRPSSGAKYVQKEDSTNVDVAHRD